MTTYTVGPSGSGATYIVDGTNDQSEINSALAAAVANPGSTVYLKGPCTYDIQTSVLLGDNTELTGDSTACLRLKNNAGWASMVGIIRQYEGNGHASVNIKIHGFEIDGNRANQTESEGDAYYNCIQITGTASSPVKNISVYNMKIHDSLGDGLRLTHGENIKYYYNDVDVMGHEGVFFIDVVGGDIYTNDIVQKCNSCVRLDNCQNINIHDNDTHKYAGTGANGNGAIQIGNEPASYGLTRLTQNINIYENTITDGAGVGILLMDAYGAAGTTAQTVHIWNNTITACGWMHNIKYNGGIGLWKWGNGLTIEYNTISGCYNAGIVVLDSIASGCTMQVNNNNILNTKVTLATDPTRMLPVSGYGILNMVPSKMAVYAEENYSSGNVTGDYYQVTPISTSTTSNGAYSGGSSTGGTTTPTTRYIPPIRIIQEELTNYYDSTEPRQGYINGVKFNWQELAVDGGKSVGQKKAPGIEGDNLTDFGFKGTGLVIDCFAFSIDELDEVMAAWYDTSRGQSKLELGGPYAGTLCRGLTVDHSSKLRLTTDVPENAKPYSILYQMEKPHKESASQKVRGRHVYGSSTWSADDTYAGNLLKNPSFEDWATSSEMTWATATSVADIEWTCVRWSRELAKYCAVASGGSNNGVQISSDGDTWSVPSGLTSATNCNNNWRGLAWGYSIGLDGGNLLPGRWVAVSSSGSGNRCMTSDDGITWTARTTPADNNWNSVCYVRDDVDLVYRYVAVASSGTGRAMYSDDGGVTWSIATYTQDANTWVSVCYSQSLLKLVAVSYDGNIMSSVDYGEVWNLASSVPSPAQKFKSVVWAETLGLFVACTEDGTQQIVTSPDGDEWTLQTTPVCGSIVTPGTGTDVATTTSTTTEGWVYSSGVTAYSTQYPGGPTLSVAALTNNHIWRIDRVFCQLRTAQTGQTAWIKITATTATKTETVLAEFSSVSQTYEDKTLDVTFETAANEAITIQCYMKSSNSSYRAYATLIGYEVTEFDGAGGATVSYTYNAWQGLTWSPEDSVLVCVAKSGTGNRAMRSNDAANWVLCDTPADNNWNSVCYSSDLNQFVSVSSTGSNNRIMTSSDYGGIQTPASWTLESEGQTRSDSVAHDGLYALEISGDGLTEDIGRSTQYIMFDPGVSYVVSAWGAVTGLTHGQLSVDIYSGNSIITQLLWDADCEYSQLQDTIRFDTAPVDAYIRIHGVDTLNSGAKVYCDDVLIERASDFELGTTGQDITTTGHVDIIPDVEVTAITSKSGTNETDGDTKTYTDPDIHSEYLTSYSLEFTYVLPALTDGKKYRLDQFACLLATANVSGLTAYARVTVKAASINSGAETQVVVFSSTTRLSSYATRKYNSEIYSATNETVTIKVYMRTSSTAGRAYMDNFAFTYTEIIPSVTSSAISIYNEADTLTRMEVCNELKPGCKITINADGTGSYQYSENFADTAYEYTVTDSAYVTYYDDYKMLLFNATGYLIYKFDTKYPITGIPYIVLNVMSGAPTIYIAKDNAGSPGTWYPLDGNTTTDISNAQAYRLLNSGTDCILNGLTKFHLKIASGGTDTLRINSIFMYASLVTIDAEHPKIFKGQVNTFGAVVDSTSSVIVTLKYRDADMLV